MKCDCNPSGQEVAGGSKVQGHPQLRVESKAILAYKKRFVKK